MRHRISSQASPVMPHRNVSHASLLMPHDVANRFLPAMEQGNAHNDSRWRDQQGMAVITVLVIVAIVAVLASILMARQTTVIHAAQAEQTRVQGRWLLQGEISRAQAVLLTESRRQPWARLDGSWNQPINGQPVAILDGGQALLYSEITDEQSKFNLTNLVSQGQLDPFEVEAFLRLCATLGVPQVQAQRIARRAVIGLLEDNPKNAVASSAHVEQQKRAQAAAQQIGLSLPLPTRPLAPRLRALEFVDDQIDHDTVARLKPYVTVLPARTRTNANTTRPEVLAAIIPGLTLDRASALVQSRDNGQWFLNRADIFNRAQVKGVISASSLRVGVTSRWFHVSAALRTPHHTLVVNALLHDDKQTLPRIIWLREGV